MKKLNTYIQEALTQIEHAETCYKEFEHSLELNDTKAVFFHLHHFIVHVANVHKLLNPRPDNSSRIEILNGKVDFQYADLKLFRDLRNHLEHFDTRLDRWIEEYDGHAFFDNNIITGAKGFPDKAFLRALDGYTYKILGEDYNLKSVTDSLKSLKNHLLDITDDR